MDRRSKIITGAFLVWLFLALTLGASGVLESLNPPLPQIILFGLVFILLILFFILPGFRGWCLRVNLNLFLVFNLIRFIGIYFLLLYSQGRLPYNFAVLGGWGDIIIALIAAFLILFVSASGQKGWYLYFVWNILGLLDILFVVATAARLAMADPASMIELLKLPLSLLPTFVVPVIIFIHLIIFFRLYKSIKAGYQQI